VTDEVLEGIRGFPRRVAELARSGRYFTAAGPFPVRHADLHHSDVVVTGAFDVLGVVDWDGACTVPWELVDAPCFLRTVPRLLNPPERYGAAGRPLDPDEAARWADEDAYAAMVREAELDAGADHKLSGVLSDRDARGLGAAMHLFAQGKMGLYGRVLDYYEAM